MDNSPKPCAVNVWNEEVGFVGIALLSFVKGAKPIAFAPAPGWSDEDVEKYFNEGEWNKTPTK